jgi:hypothetical protein
MVGHDDREPGGPSGRHLLRLEPVAVADAMRQDRGAVEPAGAEDGREERRGGDAVDVVVADQRDPLTGGACQEQSVDGLDGTREQPGIVQLVGARREERRRLRGVCTPAARQQAGEVGRIAGRQEVCGGGRNRRLDPSGIGVQR